MSNNVNETNIKEKIEAEDKKAFKPYAILMIVCLVGGGFVGFFSAMIADNVDIGQIGKVVESAIMNSSPVIALILSLALAVYAGTILKKVREEYKKAALVEDNDEQIEACERKINYVMLFSGIDLIIVMFTLAVATNGMLASDNIKVALIRSAVSVFDIFFALYIITKIQKQCINLIKEVNPEKKGSVYDINFQKEWIASCDEAERQQIYEASWNAYKAVSKAISVIWIICVVGGGLFNWGIVPAFVVSAIWLVQLISYSSYELKKTKKK